LKGYTPLVDPRGVMLGRTVAATLPEGTVGTVIGPLFHTPRAVRDDGRVFFNSIAALVPADSNGQWDVYEWEPAGVGDCAPSSENAATAQSSGGCVSLISSGTAEEEAGFLDASESGDDAFFLTSAQLNEIDEDHQLDAYDARVLGVPPTRPTFPECLGEACQPAIQPPNDSTPTSASFNGPGNPRSHARTHCGKGKRLIHHKGHARCARKRSHRKPRDSHRSPSDRRDHR
jgi:hypothetical protein